MPRKKKKRRGRYINHHKKILDAALPELHKQGYKTTVFHTGRYMPKHLAGTPDLFVMWKGRVWWVEIKPQYENSMRDTMSDVQWEWFEDRRKDFVENLRYGIVESAEDLLDFVLMFSGNIYMDDWHADRYQRWRTE